MRDREGRPCESVIDARWTTGLPVAGLASILLAALLLAFAATPAPAATTHVHDFTFKPAVAITDPRSIAVDETGGFVYVRDGASLYKFDEAGTPVDFAALGSNKLELACGFQCSQVSVDNSSGPNSGVIYVASNESSGPQGSRGVYVYLPSGEQADTIRNWSVGTESHPFCGVSTDDAGAVYVGHMQGIEGNEFSPYPNGRSFIDVLQPGAWTSLANEDKLIWPVVASMFGLNPASTFNATCRLAATTTGDIYYTFHEGFGGSRQMIRRGPSSGYNYFPGPPETPVEPATYFAVDLSDNHLYSDRETEIARFNPDLQVVETFGAGQLTNSIAVAVNSANDRVFATDDSTDSVVVFKAVITPDVSTDPAVAGQTTAALSGDVGTAGAGNVTDCKFEYGTSTTYGSSVPCTPDATGTPFSGPQAVTANLATLSKETTYHYRLVATNANGTTKGPDQTFTTHNVADVATLPATEITQSSAKLNGSFTDNGDPTSYHFEWGTNEGYGNVTPTLPAPSGTGTIPVSATITGLDLYGPETGTYHFRLVASNSSGETKGPDQTFHTDPPNPPVISGTTVSYDSPSSAKVTAQVNPQSSSTTFMVEYGTSTAYDGKTLESASIGDDDTAHAVSAIVTGLVPGTTYHFRVVAMNFGGPSYGPDQTFIPPAAPRVDPGSSSEVTQTSARLSTTASPNGNPTTVHFEYGPTAGYGQSTSASAIGGDLGLYPVSTTVAGLSADTLYHYRAVAINAIGTTYGPDQTFRTSVPPLSGGDGRTVKKKCKKGFKKRGKKCVKRKKAKKKKRSSRNHGKRNG